MSESRGDVLALREGGINLALRCHSELKSGDGGEVRIASLRGELLPIAAHLIFCWVRVFPYCKGWMSSCPQAGWFTCFWIFNNIYAGVLFSPILVFSSRFLPIKVSAMDDLLLLCSAGCLVVQFTVSADPWSPLCAIQEKIHTSQKQNMSSSIFSAVGVTEDRRFI